MEFFLESKWVWGVEFDQHFLLLEGEELGYGAHGISSSKIPD